MAMTAADFAAIHQLQARYCHVVDFGDYDGIAACFAPNGSYAVASEPNHPANRQGQDMRKSPNVGASKGHGRHMVLGSLIGGDGATARSLTPYLMTRDFGLPAGRGRATSASLNGIGIFADELSKLDGDWVLQNRRSILNRGPGIVARLGEPLEIPHVDAGGATGDLSALDCEAIRQLATRCCLALDLQDVDGFAECFTEDGVFDELVDREERVVTRGRADLRNYAASVSQLGCEGYVRHNPISSLIQGDGTRGLVSSYALVTVCWERSQPRQPTSAALVTSGLFRDEVVKVGSRWLLARRSFRKDTVADVRNLLGKPVVLASLAPDHGAPGRSIPSENIGNGANVDRF